MVNAEILALSVGYYRTFIVALTLTQGNGDCPPFTSEVEFRGEVLWKAPCYVSQLIGFMEILYPRYRPYIRDEMFGKMFHRTQE